MTHTYFYLSLFLVAVGLGGALGVSTAQVGGDRHELDELLGALESEQRSASAAAFDELVQVGEAAALRGLATFDQATLGGQRARARLVARAGGPACVDAGLARAGAPDPSVRREMARFLGALSLGEARADERIEALHGMARDDARAEVRTAAVEALAASGLVGAPRVLDTLIDELPPREATVVAEAFVQLAGARPYLFERVRASFGGDEWLDPRTLAVLLKPYARALADTPGGGTSAAERVPFLLARRHTARVVRRASFRTLDSFLDRLVELSEERRADAFLASLAADGYDAREVLFRRAYLALAQIGDPLAAEAHGEALQRSASVDDAAETRNYRLFGLHFRAVARFAQGRSEEALAGFREVAELAWTLFAERDDLRPALDRAPSFPIAAVGGSLGVERLQLAALAELWIGTVQLERKDVGKALSSLRRSHQLLLMAQLHGLRTDADYPVTDTLDDLLDRELAPRRLLLSNRSLPDWGGNRALDLALALGRALATIAPEEMPGFEPFDETEAGGALAVTDPYRDAERFALLQEIQQADLNSARRDWMSERARLYERSAREGDPALVTREALRFHPKSLRVLDVARTRREQLARVNEAGAQVAADPLQRRQLYTELARYRAPARYALTLSAELRQDGRAEEARQLSARMLADLRTETQGMSSIGSEVISARLELSISASYTDENEPVLAEKEALKAVRRLEALENTLRQWRAESDNDPTQAKRLEANIEQVQGMRAGALLSLAVNANVRMGATEQAMDYFEQAYELDQRDFMRALRACYRARAGKREEALAVLRTIHPSPSLYYNLACTYALLGDPETALDFLQRELLENHRAEGSRQRQKEWAREDPDLSSLREDPRFQRLVQ